MLPEPRATLCEASVATEGSMQDAPTGRSGCYDKLLDWGVLTFKDVGPSPSDLHVSLFTYREE